MESFNTYMSGIDRSQIRDLFLERGKLQQLRKKEYFVEQNNPSRYAGFVESGTLHYTRTGKDGIEHVVGFAFASEFICDYSSLMKKDISLVSIQAMTDCNIYVVSYDDLIESSNADINNQQLTRQVADSLYEMVYKRLLSFYCDSPEERYIGLIERCPELKEAVPLKEIASFVGVAPETISRIRRKYQNS